jgi:PcfJ-like protein
MGKKNRLNEAEERAAEEALKAQLRAHSRTKGSSGLVEAYSDFGSSYRARIEAYRSLALRRPELWRCRLRSRCPERRFLELVRFCFVRFPVASHLERAWIDAVRTLAPHARDPARAEHDHALPDFCHWYIVAAQGGSLYKQVAHSFLSKRETHHFLSTPDDVNSCQQAVWYALARAQGADLGTTLRIAQSRLAQSPITWSFGKDIARFFARHPMTIAEMNDLLDFFRASKEADDDFSLSGRGVDALRRRMRQWHRELRQRQFVCGGSWQGSPLPDVAYEAGNEEKRAIWRFRQIKTGNDLFAEGRRMHHCVVTYKSACISGHISIWSLTCEFPLGQLNRSVTLEVRQDGAIVQCRGFANRLPHANEVAMVRRWANDHGLTWKALER